MLNLMRLGSRHSRMRVSQSLDIVKMTMKLSLRRTKSRNKRFEVEMAKKEVGNDEHRNSPSGNFEYTRSPRILTEHDEKFEEVLERIGDEEFLIEKIVEKVSLPNELG